MDSREDMSTDHIDRVTRSMWWRVTMIRTRLGYTAQAWRENPRANSQEGVNMDRALRCGAWVGPVWKLGGETCVCVLPAGHVERTDGPYGADHVCSCGTWFVDSVASTSQPS